MTCRREDAMRFLVQFSDVGLVRWVKAYSADPLPVMAWTPTA